MSTQHWNGRKSGTTAFGNASLADALPSAEEHRTRSMPSAPLPEPSPAYLAVASEPSKSVDAAAAADLEPMLVILSLNNTLLFRPQRTTRGSVLPIVRPFLSTFLTYLVGSSDTAEARPIKTIVYSAARAHNVLTLLRAIELVPSAAIAGADGAYRPRADKGDVLELVFSRESMGLDESDYKRDVVTVKNLDKVWRELGNEHDDGARRTVLLEEEEQAAAAQPYSRVPIAPFSVEHPSTALIRDSVRECPSSAPDDTALLGTIHLLELLRHEPNAAAALKAGLVQRARDDARAKLREGKGERETVSKKEVDAEMAKRGRDVCAKYGVEVRKEWDGKWRANVLGARKARKEERK